MKWGLFFNKYFVYLFLCCATVFILTAINPRIAQSETKESVAIGEELLLKGNYEEAYELLIDAARKDNSRAQLLIAAMYQEGAYVDKNINVSKEWFQKSIHSGSTEAKHFLANLYMEEGEYKTALDLYLSAVDDGDISSLYDVGMIYYYGKGVEKDVCKSYPYFQKSMDNYDMRSAYFIGLIYMKDECGISDRKTVILNLLQAADRKDAGAQFLLAYFHEHGLFVVKDIQRAIDLYWEASRNGFPEAEKRLKALHEQGHTGTPLRASPR